MPAKTSIARLLRAPWNFEEDYAGRAGDTPILFTHPFTTTVLPAGTPDVVTAVDEEARQASPPTGISPVLAKFSPVPIGSTMVVFFPIVRMYQSEQAVTGFAYVWRVVFRTRSVADYTRRKRNRVPYSIGLSRFGAADTRVGTILDRPSLTIAGPRTVRPASVETIIYNRAEPSPLVPEPTFSSMRPDSVAIPVTQEMVSPLPLYPGAAGAAGNVITTLDYEQGEYDPALVSGGRGSEVAGASHLQKIVRCWGNEMAVECFKYNLSESGVPFSPRTWDFTFDGNGNVDGGEDQAFSVLLGVGARGQSATPSIDSGVRIVMGDLGTT